MITEEPTNPTVVNRFLDFLKETFKEQAQGWFGWEPTEEKKSSSVTYSLLRGRSDDKENEGI